MKIEIDDRLVNALSKLEHITAEIDEINVYGHALKHIRHVLTKSGGPKAKEIVSVEKFLKWMPEVTPGSQNKEFINQVQVISKEIARCVSRTKQSAMQSSLSPWGRRKFRN